MQMAKHEGCKLLTGGGKQPGQDKGFYVAPTIFTDVSKKHQLWNEEVWSCLMSHMPPWYNAKCFFLKQDSISLTTYDDTSTFQELSEDVHMLLDWPDECIWVKNLWKTQSDRFILQAGVWACPGMHYFHNRRRSSRACQWQWIWWASKLTQAWHCSHLPSLQWSYCHFIYAASQKTSSLKVTSACLVQRCICWKKSPVSSSKSASGTGLAAAVFSKDLERCDRVASEFECGIVWINNTQLSHISAPWGGVKVVPSSSSNLICRADCIYQVKCLDKMRS